VLLVQWIPARASHSGTLRRGIRADTWDMTVAAGWPPSAGGALNERERRQLMDKARRIGGGPREIEWLLIEARFYAMAARRIEPMAVLGVPASPGRVSGLARIVHSAGDRHRL